MKVAFSLAPALFLENGLDIRKDFILSDGDVNSRQFPMKVKILILETFLDNKFFLREMTNNFGLPGCPI